MLILTYPYRTQPYSTVPDRNLKTLMKKKKKKYQEMGLGSICSFIDCLKNKILINFKNSSFFLIFTFFESSTADYGRVRCATLRCATLRYGIC